MNDQDDTDQLTEERQSPEVVDRSTVDLAALDDGPGQPAAAEDDAAAADGQQAAQAEQGNQAEVDEFTLDGKPLVDDVPAAEGQSANWLKDLRKRHRELARENAALKAAQQQSAPTTASPAAPKAPGPEPAFADFGFDGEQFAEALRRWHADTAAYAAHKAAADAETRRQTEQWEGTLSAYKAKASALRVPDFDDVEAAAQAALSVTQQGIIIDGAKDPARVMYALGSSPALAAELAAITNPVKFAFAIASLEETRLKVNARKPATAPERTVQSGGASARPATADAQYDKLAEKAALTGDTTALRAYRKKMQAAAAPRRA